MSAARTAGGGIFITGHGDLDRMLGEIIPREAAKRIRFAARQAAKLVQREAKKRVRKRTGVLAAAIKVRSMRRRKGKIGASVVVGQGFFKGETFYGAFLEFGHKHGKRPNKRMLNTQGDYRKDIPAKPYLRPALYDNEIPVKMEFIAALKLTLDSVGRIAQRQMKLTGADRRAGKKFLKQAALIRGLETGTVKFRKISIFDADENGNPLPSAPRT